MPCCTRVCLPTERLCCWRQARERVHPSKRRCAPRAKRVERPGRGLRCGCCASARRSPTGGPTTCPTGAPCRPSAACTPRSAGARSTCRCCRTLPWCAGQLPLLQDPALGRRAPAARACTREGTARACCRLQDARKTAIDLTGCRAAACMCCQALSMPGRVAQADYISHNMMMTTAAYHGALDPQPGPLPMADANVTLAEFRHWAALARAPSAVLLPDPDACPLRSGACASKASCRAAIIARHVHAMLPASSARPL